MEDWAGGTGWALEKPVFSGLRRCTPPIIDPRRTLEANLTVLVGAGRLRYSNGEAGRGRCVIGEGPFQNGLLQAAGP